MCPNCAKAIEKGAKFCPECGHNLNGAGSKQKKEQLPKKKEVVPRATSITICPGCNNEVSKHAVSCPKCGHPLKKTAQGMSGCGLFFLIVAAIIVASILISLGL